MQEYALEIKKITVENNEDIITTQEFNYDENSHPRSVMTIRRDNNIPYPYFTQSVIDIIQKGDGKDPITRKPFDDLTIQRAFLYQECMEKFPNYSLDGKEG